MCQALVISQRSTGALGCLLRGPRLVRTQGFDPAPSVLHRYPWASQLVLMVKNPPASAGDRRNIALTSGSGRSPGGGHGNPLHCSCLENPTDRGTWWVTVHRVAKSQTRLK